MTQLDAFTRAYIEAVYFTDTGDSEQPSGELEMSADAIERAKADCDAFRTVANEYLAEACEREGYSEARAGHDFWLTRNGHGAGFWDRDELDEGELGQKLATIAQTCGQTGIYAGDDGLLHFD